MRVPDPPFWGIIPPRFLLHGDECFGCQGNKVLAWLLYAKILLLFLLIMWQGLEHALHG